LRSWPRATSNWSPTELLAIEEGSLLFLLLLRPRARLISLPGQAIGATRRAVD
jgi:hypothetical protein